jgi:hypothetical protein
MAYRAARVLDALQRRNEPAPRVTRSGKHHATSGRKVSARRGARLGDPRPGRGDARVDFIATRRNGSATGADALVEAQRRLGAPSASARPIRDGDGRGPDGPADGGRGVPPRPVGLHTGLRRVRWGRAPGRRASSSGLSSAGSSRACSAADAAVSAARRGARRVAVASALRARGVACSGVAAAAWVAADSVAAVGHAAEAASRQRGRRPATRVGRP